MRRLQNQLPRVGIYSTEVPVEEKKGDSRTKEFTTAYFYRAKDVIENQLKNPELFPDMHIGLGIEADQAVEVHHGLLYKESVKASIGDYPVRAPSDPAELLHRHNTAMSYQNCTRMGYNPRSPDYLANTTVKDTMIFPGACLLVRLKSGMIPVRITGVFYNRLSEDITLYPKFKDEPWVSVNPIAIRQSDLEIFRLNPTGPSPGTVDFDFTSNVGDLINYDVDDDGNLRDTMQQEIKGLLLLYNYRLPISALGDQANVKIYRHKLEKDTPYFDKEQVYLHRQSLFHVRQMVVPERDSTPDPLKLMDEWMDNNAHIIRKEREADKAAERASKSRRRMPDTTSKSNSQPSIQIPRKTRRSASSQPHSQQPQPTPTEFVRPTIPASAMTKRRRLEKLNNKFCFDRLVSTSHLRKTLTEDEIGNGELVLDELYFDRDHAPDAGQAAPDPESPSQDSPNAESIDTHTRKKKRRKIGISIDFFTDKFGIFRTTHRSSGGMYITIMNLDYKDRDQPRNHSLLGFTPFGASFEDAAKPIFIELAKLAKYGFDMTLHDGEEVTIYVKLLSISADMMEANALASVKGPTCLCPCRFCEVPKFLFNTETLEDRYVKLNSNAGASAWKQPAISSLVLVSQC